jgi:phosphoserine/homoserine phosphotransferase
VAIVCLDLEGVLIPEIWIGLADLTGIDSLRATTRDVPDYDQLMRQRLAILDDHGLGMDDIQRVIADMRPLDGAYEFLMDVRSRYQVIILSDTFYQFARPLMAQLDWPTLFCHELQVEADGRICDFHIRLPDHKRRAVAAFRSLNFDAVAAGESYNDTRMLAEADHGILFRPPPRVIDDFPQFPVARDYTQLNPAIDVALAEAVAG